VRILHLNVLYPQHIVGGAERFVATLARQQAQDGHDVAVATLTRHREPVTVDDGVVVHRIGHGSLFWFEDWRKHSAPVRYLNKMLTNWNPVTFNRVREVIQSFRPDVVNSHCMLSFAVDAWKAATERNIPIVHSLHEFNLICRNTNAFRNGRMCERICLPCRINEPKRWMSREVSAVVGVSNDVLQRHLDFGFFNHIPPERRSVIWSMPPITPNARVPKPQDEPFTIGFIGRIVPEKGLETLLDAVARLPKGGWRLLVAGDIFPPLDPAALRSKYAGLPIEWLGAVPAKEFYRRVDLLVVPAIWADPGPLVVHEALTNAIPVVGAKIGGIADLVEHDVTGWLYPPGDSVSLAQILEKRVRGGRDALPQDAAFARFRSETTPQHVAERYQIVYRNTIAAAST
jgi:glycosyltransferase involved in cell wall biosynthesis